MSLVLEEVSHRFGETAAVRDANLEARNGEIVCLFGHSGCGKTTLLRIAAGLEPIQHGAVRLSGDVIAAPGNETPPERRSIGMVFQDYVLFPHLSVEKNIAFGLKGRGRQSTVAAQLGAFGLEKLARRYPHELSGGQQQRVALARALAPSPRALLLDEPFASIDAVLRRRLREDMRRILKEQNVAVILVTHDPEEALALGDRVALMRNGCIIENASPQDLFDDPKTPEGARIFPGSQSLPGDIRNGSITTAAGSFSAGDCNPGGGIAVFRDGAIHAQTDDAGQFVVVDSRFVGPDWVVLVEDSGSETQLRVSMGAPLARGARVSVSVPSAKVFVFEN